MMLFVVLNVQCLRLEHLEKHASESFMKSQVCVVRKKKKKHVDVKAEIVVVIATNQMNLVSLEAGFFCTKKTYQSELTNKLAQ